MNDLLKELVLLEERYKIPFFRNKINDILAYLIHLKYLCETGQYQYDEVMSHEEIYLLTTDTNRLSHFVEREKLPINSLLRFIINIDLKQLIFEFLDFLEKPITFHNKQDKILFIRFNRNIYPYYCINGNATYVLEDALKDSYDLFKTFDEVLGIHNQYISSKDKDKMKDYDYVYIYDDLPKYLLSKNNIYSDLSTYINNNKNVVLYTNYSKVSNFSDGKMIAPFIKTIIINKQKTIMLFSSNHNDEINIINYDPLKIKNLDKLYSIIHNNRKQKDILVKTTYQELKDNNLRIGFNLYQLEKDNGIRDINKIVDKNTEYLRELNRINEIVEREINLLLNR